MFVYLTLIALLVSAIGVTVIAWLLPREEIVARCAGVAAVLALLVATGIIATKLQDIHPICSDLIICNMSDISGSMTAGIKG